MHTTSPHTYTHIHSGVNIAFRKNREQADWSGGAGGGGIDQKRKRRTNPWIQIVLIAVGRGLGGGGRGYGGINGVRKNSLNLKEIRISGK